MIMTVCDELFNILGVAGSEVQISAITTTGAGSAAPASLRAMVNASYLRNLRRVSSLI